MIWGPFLQETKKALYEYKNNGKERQMYSEILEDCDGDIELAQSRSQAKYVYKYWKIIAKGKSATIHPERYGLNMTEYKKQLFKCIEPIIQPYGLPIIVPILVNLCNALEMGSLKVPLNKYPG